MPATKFPFSCAHKGYGSICHRCAEAARLEEAANSAKPSCIKVNGGLRTGVKQSSSPLGRREVQKATALQEGLKDGTVRLLEGVEAKSELLEEAKRLRTVAR